MALGAMGRRGRQARAPRGGEIMPEQPTPEFVAVSKDDIAAFAAKLVQWGSTLTPREEALLKVIVERARVLLPDDVRHEQIRTGLIAAVKAVYAGVARASRPCSVADGSASKR
jgi:hypothetical protein